MRGFLAAIALAFAAFAGLTSAHAQQVPPDDGFIGACLERAGASSMKMQACKGRQAGPVPTRTQAPRRPARCSAGKGKWRYGVLS